jgi:hypothetical protein
MRCQCSYPGCQCNEIPDGVHDECFYCRLQGMHMIPNVFCECAVADCVCQGNPLRVKRSNDHQQKLCEPCASAAHWECPNDGCHIRVYYQGEYCHKYACFACTRGKSFAAKHSVALHAIQAPSTYSFFMLTKVK